MTRNYLVSANLEREHPTADRQIKVSMLDTMRFVFEPELKSLKHGETIEFVVTNDGAIQHEFSIGNAVDQVKHAEMMRKMPDMDHQDPNTVSLAIYGERYGRVRLQYPRAFRGRDETRAANHKGMIFIEFVS
jgi:hypothetical protein